MVWDGPKPLKSIEKQYFFDFRSFKKTMKKLYERRPQKSCFGIQNGDMGVPGSTYRQIFDVLLQCWKIIIFGRLPDGPNKSSLGAPRAEKARQGRRQAVHFLPGGPEGAASRAQSSEEKKR